jgi:hypothetical protein
MPLVRDYTKKKTEYKGRPTQASADDCPCMPCYNAHDCGYYNGKHEWVVRMACATNWNNGCPSPKPEPEHKPNKSGTRCIRCRTYL